MEMFSTTPVEIAVEMFDFVWKKIMGREFSTFPQAPF